jgi:hypothetical protein
VATVKSDYANLYATMKARGWIGMFNHPASSGQFQIGGTALAYDANGAQVMVAAEVRNTSAFSTSTTEGETGGGTYTAAFNILLERGYHVAPTSDQDNHCANWGIAGRNRTGVLLPNGAALTVANFLDALKARRAFATEDKTAQVVLTGNGMVMGQTLANGRRAHARGQLRQHQRRQRAARAVLRRRPGPQRHRHAAVRRRRQHHDHAGRRRALSTTCSSPKPTATACGRRRCGSARAAARRPTPRRRRVRLRIGQQQHDQLQRHRLDNVGVTNVEFYVDGVLKGLGRQLALFDDAGLAHPGRRHALAHREGLRRRRPVDELDGGGFSVSNVIVEPPSTQFNEAESNGSVASANTVAHSYQTIVGTMGNTTDKDYFALSLAANETVKIDMAGGPSGADYDLYLVNAADGTLKSSTGGTVTESLSYTNGASAATCTRR